jgi:hypothetical protein
MHAKGFIISYNTQALEAENLPLTFISQMVGEGAVGDGATI